MEADQSCLERGCGSLRGPVRSPQEPMSTRRWGPSRSGIGTGPISVSESWPDMCEQRASGHPPPPFLEIKKQFRPLPHRRAFFRT